MALNSNTIFATQTKTHIQSTKVCAFSIWGKGKFGALMASIKIQKEHFIFGKGYNENQRYPHINRCISRAR